MNKELISVVLPIYNVEKFLKKSIDSVLEQTYNNLEIFLVDDGATDNCPTICDEYKKIDSRIKVIHKENGGLSDARNAAINVATGKYIVFVDSDDYIEKDMIELLYSTLKENDADISTCLYQTFDEGEKPVLDTNENKKYVLTNEEALEKMLYQDNCTTSAWGKLYKRELFDGVRYPKGKICEDLPTTYLLFSKAPKIVINTAKKYYYLQRKDSIINSKFKPARMDALDFAREETEYIRKYHKDIINSAINREFMEAIFILIQIPRSKEYKDEWNKISNCIKDNRKFVIRDKKANRRTKTLAICSYLGTSTLKELLKIFIRIKKG